MAVLVWVSAFSLFARHSNRESAVLVLESLHCIAKPSGFVTVLLAAKPLDSHWEAHVLQVE